VHQLCRCCPVKSMSTPAAPAGMLCHPPVPEAVQHLDTRIGPTCGAVLLLVGNDVGVLRGDQRQTWSRRGLSSCRPAFIRRRSTVLGGITPGRRR
jgi:hypothetical protein